MTKAELQKRYSATKAKLKSLHGTLWEEYLFRQAEQRKCKEYSKGSDDSDSQMWELYNEGYASGIGEAVWDIENIIRDS